MRINNPKIDSPTTAYLVLSIIFTFAISIYTKDTSILGFGIIILLLFTFSASLDRGSTDSNLKALSWTNENMSNAVFFGILGGLLALFLSNFIIKIASPQASILVPDFSFTASISSPSVVSSSTALLFNAASQIFSVAPGEEAMARILSVRASLSFLRNTVLAYAFGTLLWIGFHIPSYTMQNAPRAAYLVLLMLSIIIILLIIFTKNIFSGIAAHSTFNLGIILIAASPMIFFSLIALSLLLSIRGVKL